MRHTFVFGLYIVLINLKLGVWEQVPVHMVLPLGSHEQFNMSVPMVRARHACCGIK